MKIVHVITSIDTSTGGPARSVTYLIEAMSIQRQEINTELNTLQSDHPIIYNLECGNGKINFHKRGFLNYSKSLEQQLMITNSDLFHGHGLWQFPVQQMAKIARSKNKPYIITPRGMLEPWALKQGSFKKKLALKLFQYNDLAKATCLHATAPMEVESIRKLGFKNPVAMIPNGVNIEDFPTNIPTKVSVPKKILFLSRIHPKKGIENLIEAWSQIDLNLRKNWVIEIVGNGEEGYIESLQQKIIKHNLQEQICIKPPVFDQDKIMLFREASLFVLPTYSENFGIVVAEAMASYTPIITTKGTPWEELNTCNAGWWIDIGVEPLKKALINAIQTPEDALEVMGKNGRKLIKKKYSMEAVADQMLELYHWVLTKENKPDFVDII
ncbi:glycosyltransferase [Mariniflexile sp.]|uniref:glycosyltransferase n=1 Tax=Mariniflexile sp. TaxID=1979402 RepID=UPI0035659574